MSSSFFVGLRSKVQNFLSPWLLSPSLFQRVRAPSAQKSLHHECEVLPSDPEWDFVNSYFFQYAPLTYSIKRVFCVHNPLQTEQFEASLVTMDGQAQNPVFSPKWQTEDPTGCRAKVIARWREFANAFSPVAVVRAGSRKEILSHVFVFPYWHGSNQEKVQSICDTGFAYFGKHNFDKGDKGPSTDVGFFGSGIYFTNSARYAADLYSLGHLLLAWVSMRSPYPVIEQDDPDSPSDREKLERGPAFENYDAHYIPVIIPVIAGVPSNPMCPTYVPCRKDQIPMWDETVVFHSNQTLPRFYVELMITLPKTPVSPVAMLTQLLDALQDLSAKPEIAQNPQLRSLFQQEKQLLFVIGDTSRLSGDSSHLPLVDQKFFDLVRQLQTGAAKLDEYAIRQFLALIPFPKPPAPSAAFFPSPFDIPSVLERAVSTGEILDVSGIKKEEAFAALGPLFRRILTCKRIHDPGEKENFFCSNWEIPCLDFSASTFVLLLENGQMVTGDSYAMRIWDPYAGKCLQSFKRKPYRYRCCEFERCNCHKVLSLEKERLLFSIDDRELVIWDLCADKILQHFYFPHYGEISDFILLKNGYIAAIYGGTICLWTLLTGECQETFEVEHYFKNSKLFSMGKDYLGIVDSSEPTLIIWSLNEKKCIFSKKFLSDFCLSDEEVVYCEDGSLFVFHPSKSFSEKQRDKPKQLMGHKDRVLCCCRLKNGHVISGSKDKTLKIWDTQNCQCVKTLESWAPVSKIWELKNGWIVSREGDDTLGVWDLQTGKLLQEFFSKDVKSIEEIGEGKILVVSKANTAIFDLVKRECVCTFAGKGFCLKEGFILCHLGHALQSINPTSGCVLQTFGFPIISSPTAPYQFPDSRKLIISDHSILEERRGVFQCVAPDMHPQPLLFLKEGLVLVEEDGNFQVINPRDGRVLNTFPCYQGRGYTKLISAPKGKLVALSDYRVDIWDRKCDKVIKSLHLKKGLGPFWLSENVRFLARKLIESFQVFLEKSAVLKARFDNIIELQNGGIVGVSEDRFLKVWDAKGKCLRILKGHEAKISFAIELQGNRLISGSEDGVLIIWDLQSGDILCTLKDHKSGVTAICELEDGLIASADRDGRLEIWNSDGSPRGLRSSFFPRIHLSSHVSSILSLKDGRFVTFSVDGKYRIWSFFLGLLTCKQEVETHLKGSFYLAQRKDGNLSIFGDNECAIFDLETGTALSRPLVAQKSFRISKEKMVSFFNGRIFLWNPVSGKCIRQMQAPSDRVSDCILLQDGSLLIGFSDGTLQKWEQSGEGGVKTWNWEKLTALLQLRDGRIVIGLAQLDRSKSVFLWGSSRYRHTLEIWSPDIEKRLSTWDGYKGGNLLQLEDGSLIDELHEGVGWDIKTGQLIYPSADLEWIRYKRKIQDFECFCVNWDFYKMLDLSQESDLQWILENDVHQLQVGIELREGFLVHENAHLQILDPITNILLRSFEDKGMVDAVFLLKDGSLATTDVFKGSWGKVEVSVWNPHDGECLRVVGLPPSDSSERKEPSSITQSRALEEIVPNGASSSILKIWSSLSESCKTSLQTSYFLPMVQLEDGSFALFKYREAIIEIWNKEANKRLEILGGGFLQEGLLLLQDGSILNWLQGNPSIRIWNPVDGKMVQVLRGHLDPTTCAIQLREGPVVSGSRDSTLKIWDLKGGNCLQTLQGHQGAITSVLQLPENRLLSGSEDKTLKIWNLVTGECLKTISCEEPVLSLFQLQDGRILSRYEKYRSYCLQLWDLRRGVPIRSLIVQKDTFDQIRFQDQVLGKEKIHLDLWHPFLMPLPFPALSSSLSPFLNRLEEQIILITAIEKHSIPKMTDVPVVEVPDKASALQAQARLHVEKREFAQALDRYFEALQFTNRSSAYLPIAQIFKEHFPRKAPLAFLQLARAQAKEEDLLGIRETLSSLSGLLKSPELFELLGECALLAKEPKEACIFYEKAMEQYEPRGRKEDIIRGYEKILACDFSNLPLYERLLKLYEEKEKKVALFYMGIFQFRDKDPKRAKALVEQAEKLDPGNPLFSWICNHSYPF